MNIVGLMIRILRQYRTNKSDRDYQSFVSLLLYALIGTLLYSGYFLVTGYYKLSFFLFLCFVLFFGTAVVFDRGKTRLALVMSLIGISLIVNISLVFAGLGSGAQYYLLSAALLFFISNFELHFGRSLALLCVIEYIVMLFVYSRFRFIYDLSHQYLMWLSQVNIVAAFGAIVYVSMSFRTAVLLYEQELREKNKEAGYLANYDQLTGLENRHYLYQKLDWLMRQSNENNTGFIVGMVDIDNFKAINDNYGHLFGDLVLKETSKSMKRALRRYDLVGRWGGEEFLIILPDTTVDSGMVILERVRSTVESTPIGDDTLSVSISITIGAAAYEKNMPVVDLLHLVDERLYSGKHQGKNMVVGE